MSKLNAGLSIAEMALRWIVRLIQAVRSGDEETVDDVLREEPRMTEEWARYEQAKRAKFGDDA